MKKKFVKFEFSIYAVRWPSGQRWWSAGFLS